MPKLYPIRIRRIDANTIFGDQRFITSRSGEFDWPGPAASVRLYEYDGEGNLTANSKILHTTAGAALPIDVPKDGLLIAEVMPMLPGTNSIQSATRRPDTTGCRDGYAPVARQRAMD